MCIRDRILAFVVAGEPGHATGEQACFPASLTAPTADGEPVEPLAADARKVADGRDRAFLKLVAGLLGVGYDQLAQREAQRKQRWLVQVAAASLAGMTLALGLAATAWVARNDAQRRQAQAEDILGFMLGDLRGKLAKVGRLELMRAVDDKAIGYFASLDPRDLTDRALEEQARSLTGIGQVRLEEGNHGEAMAAFREAHARSTALLARAPGNGQRLFDLAQAEYWIGFVAWQQGRHDDAGVWLTRYRDSAIRLAAMDRGNFDWQKEVAYGHHNLAVLDDSLGRHVEAERAMREELALYRKWTQANPNDTSVRFEAANVASWLGSLMLSQGKLQEAEAYFTEQVAGFERNALAEADNAKWKIHRVEAHTLTAEVQALQAKRPAARTNADTACALAAELTRLDPTNNDWRAALGICRWWQAQLVTTGQAASPAAYASQAAALLSAAHSTEPNNERMLIWRVRAHQQQAHLMIAGNDFSRAHRHVSEALKLIESAWQTKPNESVRVCLAWTLLMQAKLAHARNDSNGAAGILVKARQLLTHGNEPIPFLRLDPLVRVLVASGQPVEATPHRRRLDSAGYVPLQPWPSQDFTAAR